MSGIGADRRRRAAVAGVSGVTGATAARPPRAPAPTGATGTSFANVLGQGLDSLQSTQGTADNLSVQAATGTLTNAHDLMIATTQAQLATQLTVALRNKAVDAFNEVMRMQI